MNTLLLLTLIVGYIPAIFCAISKFTSDGLLPYLAIKLSSWAYLLFTTLLLLKNYQLI